MHEIDDEAGTAKYIGKPPRTLGQWRWRREGPAYIKVGRDVRYRRVDVDAWLAAQTVQPRPAA